MVHYIFSSIALFLWCSLCLFGGARLILVEKCIPFLLSVRRVVAWPGIYRGCTKKCHPAIGGVRHRVITLRSLAAA